MVCLEILPQMISDVVIWSGLCPHCTGLCPLYWSVPTVLVCTHCTGLCPLHWSVPTARFCAPCTGLCPHCTGLCPLGLLWLRQAWVPAQAHVMKVKKSTPVILLSGLDLSLHITTTRGSTVLLRPWNNPMLRSVPSPSLYYHLTLTRITKTAWPSHKCVCDLRRAL